MDLVNQHSRASAPACPGYCGVVTNNTSAGKEVTDDHQSSRSPNRCSVPQADGTHSVLRSHLAGQSSTRFDQFGQRTEEVPRPVEVQQQAANVCRRLGGRTSVAHHPVEHSALFRQLLR